MIAARFGRDRNKPEFRRWEEEALRSSNKCGAPSPTAGFKIKQIKKDTTNKNRGVIL
jgi:hypothetical protein